MCSQNVSGAVDAVEGMAPCWYSESVWDVPYPSSHAFHDPLCAGSAAELSTTPEVATHGDAVPVSNPVFFSSCEPPPPPELVTVRDTLVECVFPPPAPVTVTV